MHVSGPPIDDCRKFYFRFALVYSSQLKTHAVDSGAPFSTIPDSVRDFAQLFTKLDIHGPRSIGH